jgi:transcriptional regulator
MATADLKKGSAEMLILALLDDEPSHGYRLARLIEERSLGELRFHAASLYPILYRLEERGLIRGSWDAGQTRRRRHYKLTPKGRRTLQSERARFASFIEAVQRVAGIGHA